MARQNRRFKREKRRGIICAKNEAKESLGGKEDKDSVSEGGESGGNKEERRTKCSGKKKKLRQFLPTRHAQLE